MIFHGSKEGKQSSKKEALKKEEETLLQCIIVHCVYDASMEEKGCTHICNKAKRKWTKDMEGPISYRETKNV